MCDTHKRNKPLPVWRRSTVVAPNVAETAVTLTFTKLFRLSYIYEAAGASTRHGIRWWQAIGL